MIIEEEIGVKPQQNQLNFDFLNEKEPLLQNYEWVAKETLVVLVRAKNGLKSDFKISGKSLLDWVALATSGCQQKVIDEPSEEELLDKLRPFAEKFNFVAVFYSDTPLLKKSTFLDIMTYFSKRRMNVLRLSRGYVFRSEYLRTAKMLLSSTVEEFDKEGFTIIDNAQKASWAFKVINKRILDYHKQNGVTLFGENTIFIDADVEIEPDTIIYPNNVLKGETFIGKGVVLESGNFISNSIVCDGAILRQSFVEDSKIEKGKTVGPFEKLIKK